MFPSHDRKMPTPTVMKTKLEKNLQEKLEANMNRLTSPTVQTFDEYKYILGKIQGLKEFQDILEDVYSQIVGEDDTDEDR